MELDDALAALRSAAEPGRAESSGAYHKIPRVYLGVPNPAINAMTTEWRRAMNVSDRVALASALWGTDIFEARLAASKLLTQARIRPDEAVWSLIASWVPQFDSWAIADHAASAGGRRLVAQPDRVDEVALWTRSDHMWSRRAALVMTLPWTKQNFPTEQDLAIRSRVLGWAARYVDDRDWFIQKAVAWWLRDLSRHDAQAVVQFLADHGSRMKAFARKEAGKYLTTR